MQYARILFALIIWGLSSSLQAQMIYEIQSKPSNADVFLDGAVIGKTPLTYKKHWKGKGGFEFVIKKEGYKDATWQITEKPRAFVSTKEVSLEREYTFTVDSGSAVVAFDKLLAEFPTGKVLGKTVNNYGVSNDITWDGFVRVGDESLTLKTYDILGSLGFQTPMQQSAQLFSDQKPTKKNPRYVLGAKAKDLKIDISYDRTAKGRANYRYEILMKIDWQVLDKTLNRVVSSQEVDGTIAGLTSYNSTKDLMLEVYEDCLTKYLATGKLAELVNDSKGSSAGNPVSLDENNGDIRPGPVIPKVKPETYASSAEMIQSATQSCVTVVTDEGHGSGFLVSEKGQIMTAYHVVDGANRIEIILSNGVKFEATLSIFNEKHDVAMLQIPGSGYKSLAIGDSKILGPGSDVFTIGTPFEIELGQSVSKGIVSGKRKVEEIIYIQTDVSVSPGNSGGPLINDKGELVGIVQRKLVATGVEGVGFALPVETALSQLGITVE